MRKLEERGIVIRFVIGRRFSHALKPYFSFYPMLLRMNLLFIYCLETGSANRGDSLDRNIDGENRTTKDFLILVSEKNFLLLNLNCSTFYLGLIEEICDHFDILL